MLRLKKILEKVLKSIRMSSLERRKRIFMRKNLELKNHNQHLNNQQIKVLTRLTSGIMNLRPQDLTLFS